MTNPLLSRRRFLQLAGGLAISGAAGFGYARLLEPTRLLEPNWVEVVEQPLAIANLPDHLAGLRIAQISDIHLGQYTGPEKLLDAVLRVNRLAPDLVFLTGDYVTRTAGQASGMVEPLRALTAPAYAILGNHDLWTDRTSVTSYLAQTPVRLLVNQGVEALPGLFVAGVDDLWSGGPDIRAALDGAPAGAVSLLLAHEPDYFDRVVQADAPVAVQFSGHSHGGQVRIPSATPDRCASPRPRPTARVCGPVRPSCPATASAIRLDCTGSVSARSTPTGGWASGLCPIASTADRRLRFFAWQAKGRVNSNQLSVVATHWSPVTVH